MNTNLLPKWLPTGLIPKDADSLRQHFIANHLEAFTRFVVKNNIVEDETERIHHAMIAIRNYCLVYDDELDIDATAENLFKYPSNQFVKK